MTAAAAMNRKSVRVGVDEWWGEDNTRSVPVVSLEILGPHGGRQGWAVLTPEDANALSATLAHLATVAWARRAGAEADRVAADLGYPPAFGGRG